MQMKNRVVIAGVCFAAFAMAAHAGAGSTITFNGTVAQDGGQVNWGSANIMFYDEAGMRVTADFASQAFFLDNNINNDSLNVDDDYLFNQNSSATFTFVAIDGSPFTFDSFRAGGVFNGSGVLDIVGNLQGGGQVNHQVTYIPGGQTGQAFQLFILPDGFANPLTSVTITRSQGNFAGYDDLTFTIIPSPGALAIMALGLVGTSRRRRRH